jgi:hypothetical protein
MSYNGSGTFLINTAGQPVVSGTVISSTAFNALTADLATGLSTAITKDGQTTVTANIPMGTYKFTGLGAGTAATDSANLSQVQSTVTKLLASVSGADTITAVGSPTLGAYAAGQMFYFIAAGDNTGAVTLNIDSLGAKAVTRDGTTALAAGDIQSGEVCVVVYDGTRFQLVNGASQSASIVTENLTVNKATVLNESGGDNDTRIEGDTDANLVFVDASTDRVGFGTNAPLGKIGIVGSSTNTIIIPRSSNGTTASPVETQLIGSTFTNGNYEAGIYALNSFVTNSANWLAFKTTDGGNTTATRMILNQDGNLGLGVTPSAWNSSAKAFQVGSRTSIYQDSANNAVFSFNNFQDATNNKYLTSSYASIYALLGDGSHAWFIAPSGTAGNAITFTQAMTLDASGNLGIGTTTPVTLKSAKTLQVYGNAKLGNDNGAGLLSLGDVSSTGANCGIWRGAAGAYGSTGNYLCLGGYDGITFTTGNSDIASQTERARITSGGDFLVGKTTDAANTAGVTLGGLGFGRFVRNAEACLVVNRATNDGTLVTFQQDNVDEGSISVSGNTVSYNAFAGSHWSQLQDGSKPDILRGTVMESINELCVWPDETNERLPKSKISDTAGSKKVYGVFMAWDNDWTTTNDMYVTAVGAFICRVNGSVTVQEGDLLESNGDGTARVQADDIIRSSTIGKVTSTVKTHEYDDGSYCVPTVLYCG